ncbi:hypothetical protein ACKTEK_10020 [Tepidamorphus sp. 3E244]|uniref:hypothetical protein n=1 Tax=Tepidamorphus sp. 3E244 TaxID=3385498 RepID=UPI0038FCBF49
MPRFATPRFAVLAASLAISLAALSPAMAEGPALVTVTGKVSEPNRGPLDPFTDAFFKFQDKSFETARTFTFDELRTFPQLTVSSRAEGWEKEVTVSGPALSDVAEAAGIPDDATLAFTAIDGYTVELDAAARAEKGWILAIEDNSKPLAIGGRGPAWLIYDTGTKAASEDEEARWVWSVILIEAK